MASPNGNLLCLYLFIPQLLNFNFTWMTIRPFCKSPNNAILGRQNVIPVFLKISVLENLQKLQKVFLNCIHHLKNYFHVPTYTLYYNGLLKQLLLCVLHYHANLGSSHLIRHGHVTRISSRTLILTIKNTNVKLKLIQKLLSSYRFVNILLFSPKAGL